MDSKAMMRASIGSLALLAFAIIISFVFGESAADHSDVAVAAPVTPVPSVVAEASPTPAPAAKSALERYLVNIEPEKAESLSDRCIIIRKDFIGGGDDIVFTPSYVDRTVSIEIPYSVSNYYDRSVIRVLEDEIWDSMPVEHIPVIESEHEVALPDEGEAQYSVKDFVSAISVLETEQGTKLTLQLTKSYEYICSEDENYYYICCVEPKVLYDKIVVIDAGHGGSDPGTVVAGKENYEKIFNLDILLCLKAMLDNNESIRVYYTRTDDRYLTLTQRVNLANDMDADIFISIHCNSAKSSYIGGTEVLYNQYQNDWEGFNSKQLAQLCMESVNSYYPLMKRGIIPRAQNVLIIEKAQMPVALVEVAYLSNKSNLQSLQNPDNRRAAAAGIYDAILKAYDEMDGEK